MSPKSSKSQITMLMIVGLVLFIVISLVLYLSKSAIRKQSQQSIKKTQETAIEAQPIKEFVSKCLDKLAKDAIVLLGKQGGYLYTSQGGTLIDNGDTDEGLFFVNHQGLKVTYNILPPKFAILPYSSEIPDYPWLTFPYLTATSNAETFEGFLGINNMPSLYSTDGPNSIQTQIESFVDSNIASCLDFNIFEKQGLDIVAKPAKTSVIIGSNDIAIKSTIPMSITNPKTNEVSELSDFSANVNIRLRDIYFFVRELIENDIKNVKFDIRDVKNNKDFLDVNIIKNVLSNDDLITVTDGKSLINGKPYEYVFARRNRAPALYYIRKNVLEFQQGYIINMSSLMSNQKLKAEDPDEDNLTFTVKPEIPKVLNVPQLKFKIEVSDGQLSDYQIITVNRI